MFHKIDPSNIQNSEGDQKGLVWALRAVRFEITSLLKVYNLIKYD